jgi:PAS domain S-box-containing protein
MATLHDRLKKPIFQYLAGMIAITLAFGVREVLSLAVGPDFPEYLVFYPTVMIVALLMGLWPALFTIATTAGIIVVLWVVPWRGSLPLLRTSNLVSLGLFVVVCAFLAIVAEMYRRSRQKAAAYDKEQALRESQEVLRRQSELLKLSFDAIVVWRREGRIESWNRGAEELYGYSESEALGRTINELLASMPEAEWRRFEAALYVRRQWDGELRHVTKAGREVIVSSRLHIGTGSDGEERVLEIDRDITDQKKVQGELQQAHDELEEKVLQRTSELRMTNRMLKMVSECDQALVQVSDERELTAVICQIIKDESGYPLVWVGVSGYESGNQLQCVASAGENSFLDDVRMIHGEAALADGPVNEAVLSGVARVCNDIRGISAGIPWKEAALAKGFRTMASFPLLGMEGAAFGALVIYSERSGEFDENQATILKELADDLAFGIASLNARQERDDAQRALELKASQLQKLTGEIVKTEQRERQRIAQLLHDNLQQLLAATAYGLKSLQTADSERKRRKLFSMLGGQLRECISISRSLTSEISHPAFSEPDLAAALEWLASWMKEKHGLEVELESVPSLPAIPEETRILLLEAARELLFNVVKHSGVKEAKIRLDLDPDGRVTMVVIDRGVGFDTAKLAAFGGAPGGIGLFSLRERLALVGGGMEVSSSAGSGTRFTIRSAPLQRTEPVSAPPAPRTPMEKAVRRPRSSAPPIRKGVIRVLLIDDHTVVRNGIALQLNQQSDMQIVGEASDGESGVEMARELRPNVVVMDVNMPGMGGIEAARAMHSELPGTVIIGLSMFDEPGKARAMREAGAVDYISKSASVDALIASIRANAKKTPSHFSP